MTLTRSEIVRKPAKEPKVKMRKCRIVECRQPFAPRSMGDDTCSPACGMAQIELNRLKRERIAYKSLKRSRPKMTPIRKSARGKDCTLCIPGVCNHDPATTVLCHSNFLADGKGMGLKAPDTAAAYGCSACHDVLDGRRPRPEGMTKLGLEGVFYTGMLRTHAILRTEGLL